MFFVLLDYRLGGVWPGGIVFPYSYARQTFWATKLCLWLQVQDNRQAVETQQAVQAPITHQSGPGFIMIWVCIHHRQLSVEHLRTHLRGLCVLLVCSSAPGLWECPRSGCAWTSLHFQTDPSSCRGCGTYGCLSGAPQHAEGGLTSLMTSPAAASLQFCRKHLPRLPTLGGTGLLSLPINFLLQNMQRSRMAWSMESRRAVIQVTDLILMVTESDQAIQASVDLG